MAGIHILIIGNEVLSGEVEDRNIAFLTRRLAGLGARVLAVSIVPDEDQVIAAAVRTAQAVADRVLITGGIGPTHDDRTRAAVAASQGLSLQVHPEAEARLRSGYGPGITPAELSMAALPAGARLLPGARTGVFGFAVGPLYVFPGVPDLLADIFETVAGEFAGVPDYRVEIITRSREGDFAEPLTAIQAAFPDVCIGSYPLRDERGWLVRLILRGKDAPRVEAAARLVRRLAGGD